jgi:hypothetical protein
VTENLNAKNRTGEKFSPVAKKREIFICDQSFDMIMHKKMQARLLQET